jgi:hypothetical protein
MQIDDNKVRPFLTAQYSFYDVTEEENWSTLYAPGKRADGLRSARFRGYGGVDLTVAFARIAKLTF